MLIFRPVGVEQAGYYLDGSGPGRWVGAGCARLGLDGAVDGDDLRSVLRGCHPRGPLLLGRIPANRRAGFDLVLAAPKSFSLLAALAPAGRRARLIAAHGAAVTDAVQLLEQWGARTRRGADQRRIATGGLTAAAFEHGTSWAGDPHLHTHLVVANLVRGDDGRWSCLDRWQLGRYARAAGPVYQASLRYHVAMAGVPVGWSVRADGLSDVRGVPRAAIDACSTRRRQLLGEAAAAGLSSARGRAAAAGRSRRTGHQHERGWEADAAAAGLDPNVVARLLGDGPAQPTAPAATMSAVEDWLMARMSTFTHADVIAAVAATSPAGASRSEIEAQAGTFLRAALPFGGERWTTAAIRRLEQATITASATAGPAAGLATSEAFEAAIDARPHLDVTGRDAVRRLTREGASVDVLGRGSLIGQAAVVDAARAAWEACGHRVAIAAPSDRAQARWAAITALAPVPPPPARPSVLVVDQADRLPTVALHRLVVDATRRGTKVVLVPGGTALPRRQPASPALAALAGPPPSRLGGAIGAPDPPVPAYDVAVVAAGRDGTVRVAATAQDAAGHLVADWYAARATSRPASMVALGPDEAAYLNRLARARRSDRGELRGPVLPAGDRPLQAGDEIRALRRDGRVGAPAGDVGVIVGVDLERRRATVRWSDGTAEVDAAALAGRAVSYAYATTPAYLRYGRAGPLLALGFHPGDAVTSYVVGRDPPRALRGLGPMDDLVGNLDPPARARHSLVEPGLVGRSLADLADERTRLGAALAAAAPVNPRTELRRADEEREWLSATSRPDVGLRLAGLDRRRLSLQVADGEWRTWVEVNRVPLERWAALGAAVAWRTEALALGAELAPSVAVSERLGPAPVDARDRQAWRRAAAAIEVHRDRWLPAGDLTAPAARHLERARQPDRARMVDELRLEATCRAAIRGRQPARRVDDDLAVPAG